MTEQVEHIMRTATELFQSSPDWVAFHQRILGRDGIVQRLFPDPSSLARFELSREYQQLQRMVAQLRGKDVGTDNDVAKEPQRVITVRMPKSLHQSLKQEAHQQQTSINKLCIAKLLKKFVDQEEKERHQQSQERLDGETPQSEPGASQIRI